MQLKKFINLEFNDYQKWYGENNIMQYLIIGLISGFMLYFIRRISFFFSYIFQCFNIENMDNLKMDFNVFFFNGTFKIVKRYWTKKNIKTFLYSTI
jgi:hypothetical protein